MILLELVLQNFGPYYGRQTLNLRPNNDQHSCPIILFGGMNGGGKTTLMDAIRFALYGHRAQCSTRGNLSYGEFLTQSVNCYTVPGEQSCVELVFEHILNNVQVKFRIKRTWTRHPKGGKDSLDILIDERLDTALAQIWNERIEDLLPLGISNLFLFDGEQVKELAEQEAPPHVVIEAIRTLLGLELAERLSIDIDILVNRKRKSLADAQELINLEALDQKLLSLQSKYRTATQALATAQDKLEKAQEQQHQASAKFLSEGGKIAGEQSHLEAHLDHVKEAATNQRQAISDLLTGVLPLAFISPLLIQAQTQGQAELQHQKAKIARDVLKYRNQRLWNCIEQLALLPEQVDKIKLFIEQENQELQDVDLDAISYLAADRETLNQLDDILKHYLPAQRTYATEQLINLINQEEEITAIEAKLAAAASPEAYEKLASIVRNAQAEVVQAKASYETAKRECDELAAAIETTKKDLSRYGEQNIDRKNDEHIITAAAKVQTTLKVFRDRLTLRKLNHLEAAVAECFLYLLHKSDLVHRVEIDANTFSLSLYNFQGQLVPKHRLSAGEKQLLAIAFLWGLARVSGRKLPVAIDTPLGRLDSSHRTNLVERYFPEASHQVMLFSTDTEIGKVEVERLRSRLAIAREYLLKYDPSNRQTTIEPGYFW